MLVVPAVLLLWRLLAVPIALLLWGTITGLLVALLGRISCAVVVLVGHSCKAGLWLLRINHPTVFDDDLACGTEEMRCSERPISRH